MVATTNLPFNSSWALHFPGEKPTARNALCATPVGRSDTYEQDQLACLSSRPFAVPGNARPALQITAPQQMDPLAVATFSREILRIDPYQHVGPGRHYRNERAGSAVRTHIASERRTCLSAQTANLEISGSRFKKRCDACHR